MRETHRRNSRASVHRQEGVLDTGRKKGCLEEQSTWRRRTFYSEMGQTGRVTSS